MSNSIHFPTLQSVESQAGSSLGVCGQGPLGEEFLEARPALCSRLEDATSGLEPSAAMSNSMQLQTLQSAESQAGSRSGVCGQGVPGEGYLDALSAL